MRWLTCAALLAFRTCDDRRHQHPGRPAGHAGAVHNAAHPVESAALSTSCPAPDTGLRRRPSVTVGPCDRMATEGLDRVTLRAWWSIGSNAVAFAVVAPGIFFGFFDAADPSPRRWVTAILASAPAWWVLVRSPRLSLTLDFSSGSGHYRGLTHDVRFDLADVTVLESIWPGWPFGHCRRSEPAPTCGLALLQR